MSLGRDERHGQGCGWPQRRDLRIAHRDGTIGWRKYAPYHVVVVSAASPSIPPALVDQLGDGGRMLIPVGSKDAQELLLVRKDGFIVTEETVKGDCTFVPLLGRFAWKSEAGG